MMEYCFKAALVLPEALALLIVRHGIRGTQYEEESPLQNSQTAGITTHSWQKPKKKKKKKNSFVAICRYLWQFVGCFNIKKIPVSVEIFRTVLLWCVIAFICKFLAHSISIKPTEDTLCIPLILHKRTCDKGINVKYRKWKFQLSHTNLKRGC